MVVLQRACMRLNTISPSQWYIVSKAIIPVLRTVLHLSFYISKQTPLDVGVEIILSTRVNLSERHEDSANSGEATKDSKHFTLFIPYLFPVAGEYKRTMNNYMKNSLSSCAFGKIYTASGSRKCIYELNLRR